MILLSDSQFWNIPDVTLSVFTGNFTVSRAEQPKITLFPNSILLFGMLIDFNDVQFIEKNGMKLIYHTSHGSLETYNSFSKIADKLPDNFVRCHKSFIVNVNNIVHISLSNSSITFKNDEVCYIGPKYKNFLMEVINYDTVSK